MPVPPNFRPSAVFLREQAGRFKWDSNIPGQPFNPSHFRRNFQSVIGAVEGVRVLTPHSCRHTFATLLKRVEAPDKDKLELMGHTSTAMLRHYQDVNLADLRRITDAL